MLNSIEKTPLVDVSIICVYLKGINTALCRSYNHKNGKLKIDVLMLDTGTLL
jgi:hypothetical protein